MKEELKDEKKQLVSILLTLCLALAAEENYDTLDYRAYANIYPDVKAVDWAATGSSNGTGANKFASDEVCSRGQIVSFHYRVFAK